MEKQEKPYNIVWLVQDHVTWKQFRDSQGPKPRLEAYERLAAEGMAFERAVTVTPLCSPARASMLTGVYPHHHGITRNDGNSISSALAEELPLFHEPIRDQGYRTAYFGKWHAGAGRAENHGLEGMSLPGYGNPYSTEEYKAYLAKHRLPEPLVDLEWSCTGPIVQDMNLMEVEDFGGRVNANGFRPASSGVFKAPAEATEAFFLSQLACDWLDDAASKQEPFMLRVDVWGPHQPYYVAEPFLDTIDPASIPEYPNYHLDYGDRPAYHKQARREWRERTGLTTWEEWRPIVARAYEHFAQCDAALARILGKLEETGLAERTIVIYTADHGDIIGSGGGLFDKDSMLTEETMAIPLVVKWPGVTDKGRAAASDALVMNMDIVPTVIDLAGAEIPSHMDGQSLKPLLESAGSAKWREDLMAEHFGHKDYMGVQRVLYHDRYKYVAHLDDSDELYDLMQDPFELNNVISDDGFATILTDMKRRLSCRMGESGDRLELSLRLIEQKGLTG